MIGPTDLLHPSPAPVVNTSPKHIGRQNIRAWHIYVFAQIVAPESDTFVRRMPTPCYANNLNILQVSVYQNYAITIPLNAAAEQQKSVPTLWLGTHLLDGRFYIPLCLLMPCKLRGDNTILWHGSQMLVNSRWNVMTHGDAREGKLVNLGCSQYSSHYLGTRCIQHYYRWCAHLGCH